MSQTPAVRFREVLPVPGEVEETTVLAGAPVQVASWRVRKTMLRRHRPPKIEDCFYLEYVHDNGIRPGRCPLSPRKGLHCSLFS